MTSGEGEGGVKIFIVDLGGYSMAKKKNTLKIVVIILSIILGISVIANIWLFFSLGITVLAYDNEIETNNLAYCNLFNDYTGLVNDLTILLIAENSAYSEMKMMEETSCYE